MGVMTEPSPIASPPTSRAAAKNVTVFATAAPRAEAAKSTAQKTSDFLRPYRSPIALAPAAPSRHPNNSALAAISVCRSDNINCRRRRSRTPLITAVSKPKRNPEIAVVVASKTTYLRECAFPSTLVDLSVMTIRVAIPSDSTSKTSLGASRKVLFGNVDHHNVRPIEFNIVQHLFQQVGIAGIGEHNLRVVKLGVLFGRVAERVFVITRVAWFSSRGIQRCPAVSTRVQWLSR